MSDLVYFLKRLLFLDMSLLYYYVNLRSSIISSPFSGGIYLSLVISTSLSAVSEIFCGEIFYNFVILLAIFLPVFSAVLQP